MPDLISRFGYVPYDEKGGREQNEIRAQFKQFEDSFNAGNFGDFVSWIPPQNEYSFWCDYFKQHILNNDVSSPEGRTEALVALEICYFLCGKATRISVIERLKASGYFKLPH